jgi:hypothetical protein
VAENMPFQRARGAVDLQIEGRQLWHHQGIIEALEEALVDRSRIALPVEQTTLQFESSDMRTIGKNPIQKPLFKESGFRFEAFFEGSEIRWTEMA